jgi:FkbM family methyltransferase
MTQMNNIKNYLSFKAKFLRLKLKSFLLKKLMANAHQVLVNTQFGKMIVDPLDNHVSRQLLKTNNYNPQEILAIKKLLKKNDQVLLCGAHIGSVAIPLAGYVKKIVAIEANPKNYEILDLNITINKIRNVEIHHFAAAEKNGIIEFVMNVENSGGSKRKPLKHKDNYYYDHPEIVKVRSFPLDQKLGDNFDVVIMDIEGSEFYAMSGMQRILSNSRIFIFEFIPDHLANVAGVSVKDFVSKIPTNNFKHAFFPRQNISVNITRLEYMLNLITENDSYEDGVILS